MKHYEELAAKVIRNLRSSKDAHKPYVTLPAHRRTLTRSELADEIENETEIGVNTIASLVGLAFDLFDREKEKVENLDKI